MLKVVVIGSGNVGQHFVASIKKLPEIALVKVYARHPEAMQHILPPDDVTADITGLPPADIYIIAVKDDAIAAVSSQLAFSNRLVVHTSGSVSLDAIDPKNRRGVFYPLQTLSKQKSVDFKTVPICLEAENDNDFILLKTLADTLSNAVYTINSQQRQALHVAAVFASNFVNHLYAVGEKLCEENNIDFSILKPLILETALKTETILPKDAQTGPAVRNDVTTIQKHLDFLKDGKLKEIYTLLSQSIQANAKKL